jgi:hypothetical protein
MSASARAMAAMTATGLTSMGVQRARETADPMRETADPMLERIEGFAEEVGRFDVTDPSRVVYQFERGVSAAAGSLWGPSSSTRDGGSRLSSAILPTCDELDGNSMLLGSVEGVASLNPHSPFGSCHGTAGRSNIV